jgi:hypothetical protein
MLTLLTEIIATLIFSQFSAESSLPATLSPGKSARGRPRCAGNRAFRATGFIQRNQVLLSAEDRLSSFGGETPA